MGALNIEGMSREQLEVWIGYFLDASCFLEKHTPKAHRWLLKKLPRFFAFGECVVVYGHGELVGVGIVAPVTLSLLDEFRDDSGIDSKAVVDRWGSGPALFCPLMVVRPLTRYLKRASIIRSMIDSAKTRFPDKEVLIFERRTRPRQGVHIVSLVRRNAEVPVRRRRPAFSPAEPVPTELDPLDNTEFPDQEDRDGQS